MSFIIAGLGGIIGSVLRLYISEKLNRNKGFPIGTFLVNITGAFLLGVLSYFSLNSNIRVLILIGIIGSFTTFSTFILEGFSMLKDKNIKSFLKYTLITIIIGIMAFYLGLYISKALITN
jgi:CrcB protein